MIYDLLRHIDTDAHINDYSHTHTSLGTPNDLWCTSRLAEKKEDPVVVEASSASAEPPPVAQVSIPTTSYIWFLDPPNVCLLFTYVYLSIFSPFPNLSLFYHDLRFSPTPSMTLNPSCCDRAIMNRGHT